MKLKRNTLVLVGLALAAILLVAVLERTQKNTARNQTDSSVSDASTAEFTATESEVAKVTLQNTTGQTLSFEQTTQAFPKTWAMTEPKNMVADEAAIAFLLDQLAKSNSSRHLQVPLEQKDEFGFGAINSTVKVYLRNQQTFEMVVGGKTFDGQGRYVLVNPPTPRPTTLTVSIVASNVQEAIERPLTEWEYTAEQLPQPSSNGASNETETDFSTPSESPQIEPSQIESPQIESSQE